MEDVTLPEPQLKADEDEPEEVSTVLDKKVKVTPTGELMFYSMDGERLPDEKEVAENTAPRSKRAAKRRKSMEAQAKATPAKAAKVEPGTVKKISSKVMRLAPKETAAAKKLTKQNKEQKNKKAKSIQKKVAGKNNSTVKSKPKSKTLKT